MSREQHTQSSNLTMMTQQQETLVNTKPFPVNAPVAQVADEHSQQMVPTQENNTILMGTVSIIAT